MEGEDSLDEATALASPTISPVPTCRQRGAPGPTGRLPAGLVIRVVEQRSLPRSRQDLRVAMAGSTSAGPSHWIG